MKRKTKMEASVHTYLDNLIEWSFLVKGQAETKEILQSENGVANLMSEYNAAYQEFYNKYMQMFKDQKEVFGHALMIKIYYGIRKNEIVKQENMAVNSLVSTF